MITTLLPDRRWCPGELGSTYDDTLEKKIVLISISYSPGSPAFSGAARCHWLTALQLEWRFDPFDLFAQHFQSKPPLFRSRQLIAGQYQRVSRGREPCSVACV